MSDQNPFGEVVYSYSRSQAIQDGVLVDVTSSARAVGFKLNTVVTEAVWSLIEGKPDVLKAQNQSVESRLHDVLWMAFSAIKAIKSREEDRAYFSVYLPQDRSLPATAKKHKQDLWVHCGPGDQGEPVLTIMLVGED